MYQKNFTVVINFDYRSFLWSERLNHNVFEIRAETLKHHVNDGLIIEICMYLSHIFLAVEKRALNVMTVKEDLLSMENSYSKKILERSAGEGWDRGNLNKLRIDFDTG